MIDFRHAVAKALEKNQNLNYYKEYEKVFEFSVKYGKGLDGESAPLYVNRVTGEMTEDIRIVLQKDPSWLEEILNEGEISERYQTERPTTPMHGARYALEHRLIPSQLYEGKMKFLNAIVDPGNPLSKVFIDMMKEDNVENPYGEQPIKIDPFRIDHVIVAHITFPEPEEEPLCYEGYALYDSKTDQAGYYCIEKGGVFGDAPYLCGWNKEGLHSNYGLCPDNQEELFVNILRLFLDPQGENTPSAEASFSTKDGKVTKYTDDNK